MNVIDAQNLVKEYENKNKDRIEKAIKKQEELIKRKASEGERETYLNVAYQDINPVKDYFIKNGFTLVKNYDDEYIIKW